MATTNVEALLGGASVAEVSAQLAAIAKSLGQLSESTVGKRNANTLADAVVMPGSCPAGMVGCNAKELSEKTGGELTCPPLEQAPDPLIVDHKGRVCYAPESLREQWRGKTLNIEDLTEKYALKLIKMLEQGNNLATAVETARRGPDGNPLVINAFRNSARVQGVATAYESDANSVAAALSVFSNRVRTAAGADLLAAVFNDANVSAPVSQLVALPVLVSSRDPAKQQQYAKLLDMTARVLRVSTFEEIQVDANDRVAQGSTPAAAAAAAASAAGENQTPDVDLLAGGDALEGGVRFNLSAWLGHKTGFLPLPVRLMMKSLDTRQVSPRADVTGSYGEGLTGFMHLVLAMWVAEAYGNMQPLFGDAVERVFETYMDWKTNEKAYQELKVQATADSVKKPLYQAELERRKARQKAYKAASINLVAVILMRSDFNWDAEISQRTGALAMWPKVGTNLENSVKYYADSVAKKAYDGAEDKLGGVELKGTAPSLTAHILANRKSLQDLYADAKKNGIDDVAKLIKAQGPRAREEGRLNKNFGLVEGGEELEGGDESAAVQGGEGDVEGGDEEDMSLYLAGGAVPAHQMPKVVHDYLQSHAPSYAKSKAEQELRKKLDEIGYKITTIYSGDKCPSYAKSTNNTFGEPGTRQWVETKHAWPKCMEQMGFQFVSSGGFCYPYGMSCYSEEDLTSRQKKIVNKTENWMELARIYNSVQQRKYEEWLAMEIARIRKEFPQNTGPSGMSDAEVLELAKSHMPAEFAGIPDRAGVLTLANISSELSAAVGEFTDASEGAVVEEIKEVLRRGYMRDSWYSENPNVAAKKMEEVATSIARVTKDCTDVSININKMPPAEAAAALENKPAACETITVPDPDSTTGDKTLLIPGEIKAKIDDAAIARGEPVDDIVKWWQSYYGRRVLEKRKKDLEVAARISPFAVNKSAQLPEVAVKQGYKAAESDEAMLRKALESALGSRGVSLLRKE